MARGPGKAARNERRKAVATTCNAGALAIAVGMILQPVLSHHFQLTSFTTGGGLFLALQAFLHYVLGRVED